MNADKVMKIADVVKDRIYFNNANNAMALGNELEEWVGTPYRHYTAVKQRGADCALFLSQVLINLNIIKKLQYKYYAKDWHKNGKEEIFLNNFYSNMENNLRKDLYCEEVQMTLYPIMAGDWLCFSINSKYINHSALSIGANAIVHCLQGRGVIEDKLNTWKPFLRKTFRLYYKEI